METHYKNGPLLASLPMNEAHLHSSRLERLIGKISCELISQDGEIRKVHLRDSSGISKTLGVVRFSEVNGEELQVAHRKIVSGALLGRTLLEANISFEKSYLGYVRVVLPGWLRKEFDTPEGSSIALCSRIFVRNGNGQEGNSLYANIVEVVPPSLRPEFSKLMPSLDNVDRETAILLRAAGIREINLKGD